MRYLHLIAYALVVIGALNWLVLALFGWDIGQLLGGMDATLAKALYVLVGLAAIYLVATHRSYCRDCAVKQAM